MKAKVYISFLLMFVFCVGADCQIMPEDSIPRLTKESFLSQENSVGISKKDSLKVTPERFSISKDSLDAPVEYIAEDSMIYDLKNKRIYLYGDAHVTYTTISLKADYILLDMDANMVSAEPGKDSLGNISGIPEFADGEETFKAKGIRYNFKTRKGIITDATSIQNDLYVLSSKGKFVAKDPSDSLRTNDVIYSKDAIFTSCNLEHPHYGIRSTRQKVVPGKTVVVGPSNLEVGGVPTPIWLPFGFFPISTKAKAGLIIPRDYEYDPRYGFGISEVGYFTPLGQHWNLQVTGDYYVKKRWGLHMRSQFKKVHKYSGNFSFDYGSLPTEIEGRIIRENEFRIYARIDQDRTAHPTIKFGGNIDFTKGNYARTFNNDYNSVINNQIGSRLNLTYTPIGKPWNLTTSFKSNQNTSQGTTTINFPDVNFNMRRIYPFKKKVPGSKEQWYEKIGVSYKASAKNRYVAVDSTLFQNKWWEKMEYGAQQSADINTTFNFLKYFRITPSVNGSHTAYFKERRLTFDSITLIDTVQLVYNTPDEDSTNITYVTDTIYGQQIADTLNAFNQYVEFGGSVSLGFDIFNTLLFKKGKIRGIRHFMKPNLSFNYSPNFRNTYWDYIREVQVDTRNLDSLQEYSKFLQNGVYGSPNPRGEQRSLGFGLSNVLQTKYLSKDSTMKYLNIIDEFTLNGSYNFANEGEYEKDSVTLPLSTINFRLRSNLFKDFTSITITGALDPYERDGNNKRTDQYVWNSKRVPFEFVNASLPINNRLTIKKIRNWIGGGSAEEENNGGNSPGSKKTKPNLSEGVGFWQLFDNWSINHSLTFNLRRIRSFDEDNNIVKKDTFQITANSISIRGDLQLTPGWKITIDNISYDFKNKSLVYPSLRFYRDLHCWEMGLGWQPARGTYNFFLRVKPGSLGFIEVPYQQRNFSGF